MDGEKKDIEMFKNYKLIIVGKDLPVVENYCRKLSKSARDNNAEISGVNRFPVKRLCITTRKSPCGNGSNTWDHFEMRMYKRSFSLKTNQTTLQTMFKTVKNPAGIQVTLQEDQE